MSAALFMAPVLAGLGFAALVNIPLSLYMWVPTAELQWLFVPVVESVLTMWLVHVAVFRASRGTRIIAGLLLGMWVGISAAEAFFRFFYARSFSLRGDLPMVRGALLLFLGEIGPIVNIITPITIIVLVLLLGVSGWLVVYAASTLLEKTRPSVTTLIVATGIAIIPIGLTGQPSSITATTVAAAFRAGTENLVDLQDLTVPEPVTTTESANATTTGIQNDDEAQPVETPTYRLPGIKDRDLYVFLIEAYGYATVNRPELAQQIGPWRNRLETALNQKGYGVATRYLESPVAGGYSWLADATFLTGQWIDSQERFLQLYDANVPSFSGMLHDAGYYTYTIRPGTVHEPWPEGWDLFSFEESIIAYGGSFQYRGPRFSYVSVPDQFAIWTGHRRIQELTGPGGSAKHRPLLAYFQLVSSHTPFSRIPPLITEWDQLNDGDVYHRRTEDILQFDNGWTGGTQLIEGYVASISYVFSVLTDYVENVMDHRRDPIIIILGDHEPQRPIRSPRSVRSVPVHIATRDEALLRCLSERGYDRGIHPIQPPPHDRLSSFFPTIVEIARECK